MNELPLLSVVLTAYSTKRLNEIYELLESIKAQSHSHIEIIFVFSIQSSFNLFTLKLKII